MGVVKFWALGVDRGGAAIGGQDFMVSRGCCERFWGRGGFQFGWRKGFSLRGKF